MLTVEKALDPEERALLGNIKSLITQLEGAVGGSAPVEMCADTTSATNPATGNGVTKADGTTGDPGTLGPNQEGMATQEKPVHPHVAKTEGKGESARMDAEEKLGELPVTAEEAISVLKSLFGSTNTVQKSAVVNTNADFQRETLNILKSLVQRVNEQEFTLQALIDGKSIADEVLKVEKSAPQIPIQPSSNDILNLLTQAIQKSATTPQPQRQEGLSDVLSTLASSDVWGRRV